MIVVYTAIFGGYDRPSPVEPSRRTIDYHVFTDSPQGRRDWCVATPVRTESDPRRENRRFKILAHHWFPRADYTIYIDGNLRFRRDPAELIDLCESLDPHGDAPLFAFRHNKRNCVYQEADECIRARLDREEPIRRQMARYQDEGYPAQNGLLWGGLLIRRRGCEEFNRIWWQEVRDFSCRDQLSLPYALWKTGIAHCVIDMPIPFYGQQNPYVERVNHLGRQSHPKTGKGAHARK